MFKKIMLLFITMSFFSPLLVINANDVPVNISEIIEDKDRWSISGSTFPNTEITLGNISTKANENGYFKLEGVVLGKEDLVIRATYEKNTSEIIIPIEYGEPYKNTSINRITDKPKQTSNTENRHFETIEDVAVFTSNNDPVWSDERHVGAFAYDMARNLSDNHDQITNGAIFRSVIKLIDQYGNVTPKNVILVYLKQETIDKINFDNWPSSPFDLYYVADASWAHPLFKYGELKEVKSGAEFAPELYFQLINSDYLTD